MAAVIFPRELPKDQRAEPRQRCLLRGRLEFEARRLTIDCTIRNITASGARLVFGAALALPNEFDLVIEGQNIRHKARLAWSTGLAAGVSFL